jgi:uncharacterized protein
MLTKRDTINELILQPTPFCNINCKYCYLPLRSEKARMSEDVLAAAFRLLRSQLVGDRLAVVWALGEPMSLPIDFYECAIAIAREAAPPGLAVRHGFQTNATLVTPEWCEFFKREDVAICVSVDGPRELHDANRVTRAGAGTYEKAMEGIRLLRSYGLEVKAISVISHDSLKLPDELFRFFEDSGIASIGLNMESIVGVNERSSHQCEGSEEQVRAFLIRIFQLFEQSEKVSFLREYNPALVPLFKKLAPRSAIAKPIFHQVCVDWRGNATLFSPALLNMKHPRYGDFILGNLCRDSIESMVTSEKFERLRADIDQGVEQCWNECAYFSVCGGGLPAHKLFENGSFASTETLNCRLTRKVLMDAFISVHGARQAAVAPAPDQRNV